MHRRRTPFLSIVTLMSICLTATAAVSQTKPTTTNPRQKAAPVVAKAIPPIKCTDPDSMAACKSFKQLVVARDQHIMKILQGQQPREIRVGTTTRTFTPSKYYRHVAYICLAQKSDRFMTVDFDVPRGNGYRPHSFWSKEDALRQANELSAFMSPPPPNHLIDSSVQDQWFDEHLDIEVYDFNSVDVYEYRNGLHVYSGTDYGKWGRLSGTENEPLHDDDAAFEGAYAWLAGHAGVDKDAPDFGDNPEHPKIYIVDGTVHVRYRFENNNGGTTDYGLHIQRSTGRYTETFTPSNMDAFEHAGTCMIFQQ